MVLVLSKLPNRISHLYKPHAMADCFVAPIIAAASNFPEAKGFVDTSPNLLAWMARMNERESFTKVAS